MVVVVAEAVGVLGDFTVVVRVVVVLPFLSVAVLVVVALTVGFAVFVAVFVAVEVALL